MTFESVICPQCGAADGFTQVESDTYYCSHHKGLFKHVAPKRDVVVAFCGLDNCGIIAEGRCAYCGRAFCRSHRSISRRGYDVNAPWPYGPVINGCSECQQRAIDKVERANHDSAQLKQANEARIAALPRMSKSTLVKYLRSGSGSFDFNGERVEPFSSRDAADAMTEIGRSMQKFDVEGRGLLGGAKFVSRQGWIIPDMYQKDYLLIDGSVQPTRFGSGKPEVREIAVEEIIALSTGRSRYWRPDPAGRSKRLGEHGVDRAPEVPPDVHNSHRSTASGTS
jgi:hypothetical protein